MPNYWPTGGGGIADVTGTAPITSTGGSTPDIGITTFNGTKGAVPTAAGGDAGKFLRADGSWQTPAGSGVSSVGATAPLTSTGGSTPAIACPNVVGDSGSGGIAGLVPAPGAGDSAAGKFLKANGTWSIPSGGGGGATYSPPYEISGGNNYGPIAALTPPATVFTAWVNQGGATITNVNNSLVLFTPGDTTGQLRMRVVAVGSVPYTLIAAVAVAVRSGTAPNNDGFGIGCRDSASGKVQYFMYDNSGNVVGFNFTNPTTFASTAGAAESLRNVGSVLWMRLQNDGVNRTFSISTDGSNWLQIYSVAFINFLVEDQLAIVGCSASGAAYPAYGTLLHWSVSHP